MIEPTIEQKMDFFLWIHNLVMAGMLRGITELH